MERNGLVCLFIALVWAGCLPCVAHSNPEQLAQTSVCKLTHFGPDHDGRVYKTLAVYSTDFHHGAWLVDPTNTNCWVQLGVQQSDSDGSVARFMQVLVDGVMRHGPGTKRLLRAEVVFHWVKTDSHDTFASNGKPWVPKGEVELRRVFSSAPATVAPNHSFEADGSAAAQLQR
jgi:hypothetical protein